MRSGIRLNSVEYFALNLCFRENVDNPLQNSCLSDTRISDHKNSPDVERTEPFRQRLQDTSPEVNVGGDRKKVEGLARIANDHARTPGSACNRQSFTSLAFPAHSACRVPKNKTSNFIWRITPRFHLTRPQCALQRVAG